MAVGEGVRLGDTLGEAVTEGVMEGEAERLGERDGLTDRDCRWSIDGGIQKSRHGGPETTRDEAYTGERMRIHKNRWLQLPVVAAQA